MTNEEAIKELKIIREDYWDEYKDPMPALDMAIKALEQEPCEDAISRKTVLNNIFEDEYIKTHINGDVWERIEDIINDLTYVKPKPIECEDCISREQAIEQCGFGMTNLLIADNLRRLPSVQPKLIECEDAISRQMVLEYIEGSEAELGHSSENELVCRDIKEFPPVTPQPKTGHWISYWDEEARCYVYKCPECGNKQPFDTRYCWECGTRLDVSDINDGKYSEIPKGSDSQGNEKINCKSTKCEKCINHNYCDFEPQESEEI